LAELRRVFGVVRPATVRLMRASMDQAQRALQPIRLAGSQTLAAEAQADRAAVSRLRAGLVAAGATIVGLLGWVMWLLLRDAKRAAEATQALRRANLDLEAQMRSRTADLRESSERLRSIIDSAADAIVVIGLNGRIESFSPSAERLFGYSAAEVMGRNVTILMPSPYHEEHDGYLATAEARIIGIGRQVNGRRRDGTTFPLHLSVGEMSIGGERKFTGLMHDLSARVRLEEQLREQTTLARLGEMAAVIAHEVKNPLAGIRGAIQVIGGRLPGDSKDGAMVTEIVSRIDALNELMKDLLLFARPPQPHPAAVEIGSLLAATTELLADDPAFTNVSVRVDGAAPRIFADAALLKIVFVNLLINAAHAMPQGGTIQVSIGAANGTCQIAFSDAGPGIPSSVREKIFTPFFTTKSRGTGLGLPTARRLVEAHRGTISITCPPAGGTTVLVQLPTPTVEAA
jgi:two-component system sensor kinase FixL